MNARATPDTLMDCKAKCKIHIASNEYSGTSHSLKASVGIFSSTPDSARLRRCINSILIFIHYHYIDIVIRTRPCEACTPCHRITWCEKLTIDCSVYIQHGACLALWCIHNAHLRNENTKMHRCIQHIQSKSVTNFFSPIEICKQSSACRPGQTFPKWTNIIFATIINLFIVLFVYILGIMDGIFFVKPICNLVFLRVVVMHTLIHGAPWWRITQLNNLFDSQNFTPICRFLN